MSFCLILANRRVLNFLPEAGACVFQRLCRIVLITSARSDNHECKFICCQYLCCYDHHNHGPQNIVLVTGSLNVSHVRAITAHVRVIRRLLFATRLAEAD